jgi:hypothetical protein
MSRFLIVQNGREFRKIKVSLVGIAASPRPVEPE